MAKSGRTKPSAELTKIGAPTYTKSVQALRFYRRNVWISDEAWGGIRELMQAQSYGRNMVRRWLASLPTDPTRWRDARPEWMRDFGIEQLEPESSVHAKMPIWTLELPRLPRTMWMERGTWDALLAIARYWHISNHQRYDSCSSEISRVGSLMEAIGLGHLVMKPPPRWLEAGSAPELDELFGIDPDRE